MSHNNTKKKNYKELDHKKHILTRSNMYVGAIDQTEETVMIVNNDKMEQEKITYVPAIIKIINEIIDNAIDVYIDSKGKYSDRITIDITNDFHIKIKDNGTGIPVEKNDKGQYIPFMCFGKPMAGSNFEENRSNIGMFGIGAYLTNVFSKHFRVKNIDMKDTRYEALWKDNATFIEEKIGKKNHDTRGVSVEFQIDLSRFHYTIDNELLYRNTIKMIHQRLLNISALYSGMTFIFNGEKIKIKNPKDFVEYFGNEYILQEHDNYFIAVLPNANDDFGFHTYVNGLYLKSGGNHVDLITDELVKRLRDKLMRRYKI